MMKTCIFDKNKACDTPSVLGIPQRWICEDCPDRKSEGKDKDKSE